MIESQRRAFVARVAGVNPARLVFIDESGSHIAMTRAYARAPRGARVFGRVPRNRGSALTMIGALGLSGFRTMMTIEGGTTGEVFKHFVMHHLVPTLAPGDVVVMDNLGAHHATGVRAAIEGSGARLEYLPAYSPDLNPIELAWSKVKAKLNAIGARTVPRLVRAVATAVRSVTAADGAGWFKHSGYCPQPM